MTDWFDAFSSEQISCKNGYLLDVKEWRVDENRLDDGFHGSDFCHSSSSPVRIIQYLLLSKGVEDLASSSSSSSTDPLPSLSYPRLVAPVLFTPRAESGRGYCHGGSMCAVMDDAIGWMGFCASGECRPWEGFTVQV